MTSNEPTELLINDETFLVREIFPSLQGEGPATGLNCLFLRFHLCNLRCGWCDTKDTWTRFSGPYQRHDAVSLQRSLDAHPHRHVVLTGGEPCLFRLDRLVQPGRSYHVESNGSIIPTVSLAMDLGHGTTVRRAAMDPDVIDTLDWVISPKLTNSGQPLFPEALAYWTTHPAARFKFIVDRPADIEEVESLIGRFDIDRDRVWLGLMGSTAASQRRGELVARILEQGFHLSPRLHILLSLP